MQSAIANGARGLAEMCRTAAAWTGRNVQNDCRNRVRIRMVLLIMNHDLEMGVESTNTYRLMAAAPN